MSAVGQRLTSKSLQYLPSSGSAKYNIAIKTNDVLTVLQPNNWTTYRNKWSLFATLQVKTGVPFKRHYAFKIVHRIVALGEGLQLC